jgi:hypothetical protein
VHARALGQRVGQRRIGLQPQRTHQRVGLVHAHQLHQLRAAVGHAQHAAQLHHLGDRAAPGPPGALLGGQRTLGLYLDIAAEQRAHLLAQRRAHLPVQRAAGGHQGHAQHQAQRKHHQRAAAGAQVAPGQVKQE